MKSYGTSHHQDVRPFYHWLSVSLHITSFPSRSTKISINDNAISKRISLRHSQHCAWRIEFENAVLVLKMHKMSSIHTTLGNNNNDYNNNNTTIIRHFGFVFEENLVRKVTLTLVHELIIVISPCFLSIQKCKARIN